MILNGWKEIATYVNSSVRTVQRWEKIGMPIVRPVPGSRGSVIAYSKHLDAWIGRSHKYLKTLRVDPKLEARGGGNFYGGLLQAQSLTQKLRQTNAEMADRMRGLQVEIALLRENMERMALARNHYLDEQPRVPIALAEAVSVPSVAQKRRPA